MPIHFPSSVCRAAFLCAVLSAAACTGETGQVEAAWPDAGTAYTFDRPGQTFELPGRLKEISGLTVLDDDHLGAIQDEKGILYVIELASGEIVYEETFGPGGDYEAIERVEDRLFVLRSDGYLFEITGWSLGNPEALQVETGLHAGCDAEGLAYQASLHRLLIACKEEAGAGLRGYKAIYAYDLAAGRLSDAPVYLIDVAAFTRSIEEDNRVNDWIRTALAPLVDLSGFKPSGLAVHPVTQEIYVLSSVRKAIVVLGADGSVTGAATLPEALLNQPEGLAFLPNGDLVLSSEGGIRGALMRFYYQP